MTSFMFSAWLIKLYCFLRHGPSRLYFRVYRVIERQPDLVSHSIVFENTQNRLFVETLFSSKPIFDVDDTAPHQIEEMCELSDAMCAIESLQIDMPLEAHSKTSKREYGQSIDEAIDKGRAFAEQMLSELDEGGFIEYGEQKAEKSERRLQAYITVEEGLAEETTQEGMIRRLAKELRKKTGGKEVRWERIRNTSAGRECHVLVIDEKQEHRVP